MRFPISGMMALIAYVAALLGASLMVRGVDGPVAVVVFGMLSVELGLLCSAILGIAYCEGPRRGFWAGFTAFGWGFVLATLIGLGRDGAAFTFLGLIPFAYIGGLVGRGFAERAGRDRDRPGD